MPTQVRFFPTADVEKTLNDIAMVDGISRRNTSIIPENNQPLCIELKWEPESTDDPAETKTQQFFQPGNEFYLSKSDVNCFASATLGDTQCRYYTGDSDSVGNLLRHGIISTDTAQKMRVALSQSLTPKLVDTLVEQNLVSAGEGDSGSIADRLKQIIRQQATAAAFSYV